MTITVNTRPENWLVVGLGNPGPDYELTRHNVGFMVVDELARRWGITVSRTECRSLIGQKTSEGGNLELVKPQTYMNLSGEAVSCLLRKDERDVSRTIIIVDDLAIPFGTVRLRRKGSDGGHNGLKSLTACLKTENYARLRIGIKPDHPLTNSRKFVLERFPKGSFGILEEIVETAANAVEVMIEDGIERAMSRFNS
ncbi:MAG: aminoacyl-tRNA hydrolase [Pyrinomonadaceae bacterium]|nr:aminoacyl-tRNA hydrolase [Pyrinomonadaceae bacterium]